MATLRKTDMSRRVADKLSLTGAEGTSVLNAVLDSIREALAEGDRVVLTGFGAFEVRQVKARRIRPIRAGQARNLITVPAHRRVGFTASRGTHSAVEVFGDRNIIVGGDIVVGPHGAGRPPP